MNTLLLTFSHPPVSDSVAGRVSYVIAALRWIPVGDWYWCLYAVIRLWRK
jgi:hypothetical protein